MKLLVLKNYRTVEVIPRKTISNKATANHDFGWHFFVFNINKSACCESTIKSHKLYFLQDVLYKSSQISKSYVDLLNGRPRFKPHYICLGSFLSVVFLLAKPRRKGWVRMPGQISKWNIKKEKIFLRRFPQQISGKNSESK